MFAFMIAFDEFKALKYLLGIFLICLIVSFWYPFGTPIGEFVGAIGLLSGLPFVLFLIPMAVVEVALYVYTKIKNKIIGE